MGAQPLDQHRPVAAADAGYGTRPRPAEAAVAFQHDVLAVVERGHHATAAHANDGQPSQPRSLRSEDGKDDLDVRRVGAGLAHGLDVLRRPVDLGEAVHELDQLQPVGAVDVLLARVAGQHDLAGEVVDLRIHLDLRHPSAVSRARALAVPVCSARRPPVRDPILVLRDQLSTCRGFLLRRESRAAVRPGLSTGSDGPAI